MRTVYIIQVLVVRQKYFLKFHDISSSYLKYKPVGLMDNATHFSYRHQAKEVADRLTESVKIIPFQKDITNG